MNEELSYWLGVLQAILLVIAFIIVFNAICRDYGETSRNEKKQDNRGIFYVIYKISFYFTVFITGCYLLVRFVDFLGVEGPFFTSILLIIIFLLRFLPTTILYLILYVAIKKRKQ